MIEAIIDNWVIFVVAGIAGFIIGGYSDEIYNKIRGRKNE